MAKCKRRRRPRSRALEELKKRKAEELNAELEPRMKLLPERPGGSCGRATDSPCVPRVPEYGKPANVEHPMEAPPLRSSSMTCGAAP